MTSYFTTKEHPMSPELLNSAKAGAWTSLFTFVTLFGLSLVGWIGDLVVWASSNGIEAFPDLSTLGYAAVVAVASAASGFVNFVVRYAQAKTGLPGSGPSYVDTSAVEKY